jgi:hypothetical protein
VEDVLGGQEGQSNAHPGRFGVALRRQTECCRDKRYESDQTLEGVSGLELFGDFGGIQGSQGHQSGALFLTGAGRTARLVLVAGALFRRAVLLGASGGLTVPAAAIVGRLLRPGREQCSETVGRAAAERGACHRREYQIQG